MTASHLTIRLVEEAVSDARGSDDLTDLLASVSGVLQRRFPVDRLLVAVFAEGAIEVVASWPPGAGFFDRDLQVGYGLTDDVWRSITTLLRGETIFVPLWERDSGLLDVGVEREGLQLALAGPLREHDGAVLGALALFSRSAEAFDERDVPLFQRLTAALERSILDLIPGAG